MRSLLLLFLSVVLAVAWVVEAAVVVVEDQGEENAVETIPEIEKGLKKMVGSGVKMAMPYMMDMVTELKINHTCMQALFMWLRGVMEIKDWAIQMLDAVGKPTSGILQGTPIALGDYDECLDVEVPRKMRPMPVPPYTEEEIAFRGQYCAVQLDIPPGIKRAAMDYQIGNRSASQLANSKTFLKTFVKIAPIANVVNLRIGMCIPSICSADDLEIIATEFSSIVNLRTSVVRCEIKEDTVYRTEHIIIMCGIGVIALLVFIGTSIEVLFRYKYPDLDVDTVLERKSVWIRHATAFSFARNTRNLLCLKNPTDSPKISCFRGMKFLSVCLYILVWTYATPLDFHFLKYRSAFNFFKFLNQFLFSIVANGSVGVDTIILIAGLQVSYRFWSKNANQGIVLIPKFILKWYTRLTLSQCIIICLALCLPLVGNGPLWGDIVQPVVENCRQRWWMNLVAFNNFWPTEDVCLPHTWMLTCLVHLTLIGSLLLFILTKSISFGIFVSGALILGSSIAIAIVSLMKDLPPTTSHYFLSFANIKSIWESVFIQAYDHLAAFCIGILLGYFLSHRHELKLGKVTVTLGWCATIVCNLSVLFGLYGYSNEGLMDKNLSAFFAAAHRTAWSMGIAWISIACAYGYGGVVTKILCWKIFIICDRLANLTYLLHPIIIMLNEGQLRENMYMGHLLALMYAVAYIAITLVLAAVCYITCVSPFLYFEKKFWYYETPSKTTAEISETPKSKVKFGNIVKEKGKFENQLPESYKQRITTLFNM